MISLAGSEEQRQLSPGDVLDGRYRVERVIGAGAMGVVISATHIDLDQKVALKLIMGSAAQDDESVKRLMREAQAAAKIDSEHVARVTNVGRLESGEPFIVMEYLDGCDLGALIEEDGALSPRQAVIYLLQACEALAQAHAVGIVHRDLKPENLFLAKRSDGSARIKVLDFGISKSTGGSHGASMTRTGTIMGSPVFMAPEQWVDAKLADARSDIWALGASLYAMLGGDKPFTADSLPALCRMVMNDEPADLSDTIPGLDRGLMAVTLKCLEKEPEDRYQSVAELAIALLPFGSRQSQALVKRIARLAGHELLLTSDSEAPPSADLALLAKAPPTDREAESTRRSKPSSTSVRDPSSSHVEKRQAGARDAETAVVGATAASPEGEIVGAAKTVASPEVDAPEPGDESSESASLDSTASLASTGAPDTDSAPSLEPAVMAQTAVSAKTARLPPASESPAQQDEDEAVPASRSRRGLATALVLFCAAAVVAGLVLYNSSSKVEPRPAATAPASAPPSASPSSVASPVPTKAISTAAAAPTTAPTSAAASASASSRPAGSVPIRPFVTSSPARTTAATNSAAPAPTPTPTPTPKSPDDPFHPDYKAPKPKK